MHGKVTKYGGKGAISTWKLLNYKVNSVCLTYERNTYKKGNFFRWVTWMPFVAEMGREYP